MSRKPSRIGRSMEPQYVKRRQRGMAVLIASLVLIIGGLGYIGFRLLGGGSTLDYEGQGNGVTQLVQVPEGSSMGELAPELAEKNVVKTSEAFSSAANSNPRASQIKPGFYRLQEEMSAKAAVEALLDEANMWTSRRSTILASSSSASTAAFALISSWRR